MSASIRLSSDWKNLKSLAIFGFGRIAQGNIDLFLDLLNVTAIIDNNPAYQNQKYRDVPIKSFKQYISVNVEEKIVVLSGKKVYSSILNELENSGLKEYEDFCHMTVFFEDWFYGFNNKICLGRTIVSLTTYCTLNCKNCNMLTPYNKKKRMYDLEFLKQDVQLLLDKVDFVSNFVVVGGEPLLFRQLPEYIEYVGENYRNKIGNIQIITNGMLMLSERLISIIKKYNVEIRISDYTNAVDYKEKLSELKILLEEKQVKWISFKQDEWLDFGFPEESLNMTNDEESLRQHMLACQPMCPILHDGKIYYCTSAWAAEESGLYKLEPEDIFDLKKIHNENDKYNLLSFYMGNVPKGYVSFCKVCRGFDEKIQKVIPGAIQF